MCRPSRPYVTFAADCVATAPTPARACGTTAPTARNLDATAMPRSPVCGSRATIEKVIVQISLRAPDFEGIDVDPRATRRALDDELDRVRVDVAPQPREWHVLGRLSLRVQVKGRDLFSIHIDGDFAAVGTDNRDEAKPIALELVLSDRTGLRARHHAPARRVGLLFRAPCRVERDEIGVVLDQ